MNMPRPSLTLCLLFAACFTLATWLEPQANEATQHGGSGGLLKTVLGDGRRLFANHFFVKADIYFHSGYYPSIFEQAQRERVNAKHMMEDHDHEEGSKEEEEHEKAMDFLGQPKDWIDRFGRHFYPAKHSHLDKPGQAKEIVPWLRLSAELDPKQVGPYIVASFYLRKNLKKPDEAEAFLRDGLRASPDSFEILFELGSIYYEDRHEPDRARNLWELALKRWHEQDRAGINPDKIGCDQILANLAHLEEEQGNVPKAISYLEEETAYSPSPDAIKKHIGELKEKPPAPSPK
jgi:tetratricopeptide (TPR) repeat protein